VSSSGGSLAETPASGTYPHILQENQVNFEQIYVEQGVFKMSL
jgi:hypothetical protein